MFSMAEDTCLTDTTFTPRFVPGTLVEEGLTVDEEFGTVGAEGFFVFFAGFDFYFF